MSDGLKPGDPAPDWMIVERTMTRVTHWVKDDGEPIGGRWRPNKVFLAVCGALAATAPFNWAGTPREPNQRPRDICAKCQEVLRNGRAT